MKKLMIVLAVFALPTLASANMKISTEYKAKVDKEGKCTVCHTAMGKKDLNEKGAEFKKNHDYAIFKK